MDDAEATVSTLKALRDLGVQVAIDDFGTGYSSLSYLRRFPVDTLKIDRSFVDGLGHDPQATAIVRSILALASTLGMSTTGEGVETAAQEAQLRALGCDRAQGYLFARPLPADEFDALLAQQAAPADEPRAA
jgi:EAL domain-containing protein (putative c-di-GMP-specific phosphodiesterase class I)